MNGHTPRRTARGVGSAAKGANRSINSGRRIEKSTDRRAMRSSRRRTMGCCVDSLLSPREHAAQACDAPSRRHLGGVAPAGTAANTEPTGYRGIQDRRFVIVLGVARTDPIQPLPVRLARQYLHHAPWMRCLVRLGCHPCRAALVPLVFVCPWLCTCECCASGIRHVWLENLCDGWDACCGVLHLSRHRRTRLYEIVCGTVAAVVLVVVLPPR